MARRAVLRGTVQSVKPPNLSSIQGLVGSSDATNSSFMEPVRRPIARGGKIDSCRHVPTVQRIVDLQGTGDLT